MVSLFVKKRLAFISIFILFVSFFSDFGIAAAGDVKYVVDYKEEILLNYPEGYSFVRFYNDQGYKYLVLTSSDSFSVYDLNGRLLLTHTIQYASDITSWHLVGVYKNKVIYQTTGPSGQYAVSRYKWFSKSFSDELKQLYSVDLNLNWGNGMLGNAVSDEGLLTIGYNTGKTFYIKGYNLNSDSWLYNKSGTFDNWDRDDDSISVGNFGFTSYLRKTNTYGYYDYYNYIVTSSGILKGPYSYFESSSRDYSFQVGNNRMYAAEQLEDDEGTDYKTYLKINAGSPSYQGPDEWNFFQNYWWTGDVRTVLIKENGINAGQVYTLDEGSKLGASYSNASLTIGYADENMILGTAFGQDEDWTSNFRYYVFRLDVDNTNKKLKIRWFKSTQDGWYTWNIYDPYLNEMYMAVNGLYGAGDQLWQLDADTGELKLFGSLPQGEPVAGLLAENGSIYMNTDTQLIKRTYNTAVTQEEIVNKLEVSDLAGAAENLIPNGGFEKGLRGWTIADNAYTGTAEAVGKNDAQSGGYVLQATKRINLTSDFIPVDVNMKYKLEGYVRKINGTQRAYIGLRYYDGNRNQISYNYPAAGGVYPGTVWSKYEGFVGGNSSFAFPSDTKFVRVHLWLNYSTSSSQVMEMDNIRLTANGDLYSIDRSAYNTLQTTNDNATNALNKAAAAETKNNEQDTRLTGIETRLTELEKDKIPPVITDVDTVIEGKTAVVISDEGNNVELLVQAQDNLTPFSSLLYTVRRNQGTWSGWMSMPANGMVSVYVGSGDNRYEVKVRDNADMPNESLVYKVNKIIWGL